MNKHKPAHNAKARHLCFTLLWFHLVLGGVPGPCRHSVTKDHLFHLNRLIDNQLENGCAISYLFTENQSLSKVCYIKAVFPQILELLNTHFQYGKRSDNRRYVNALKKVIYDIYSQRCIPEINEEIEDNPVKFLRVQNTSPKEALRKAKQVIQMYMGLIKENRGPVDWNCEEEYAGDYPESTTALHIPITDDPACHCSCPILAQMTLDAAVSSTSAWSRPPQTTLSTPISSTSPRPHTSQSTKNDDARMSLARPGIRGRQEQILLDGSSTDRYRATEIEMSRRSPHVTGVKYVPAGSSQDKSLVPEVDNVTPTTFLYDVAAPSSEDRIYVLAKRSLDARDYGIQQASETDSYLPQVSKPYPQAKDTGVMYLDNLDYQKQEIERITTEEGHYLKKARKHLTEFKITPRIAKSEPPNYVWAVNSAVVIKEVQSIKEAEDPDVAFLQGPSGVFRDTEPRHYERSVSNQTAVIITAVCAGVLLMITLHCFRAKRRLQVPCHPPAFQNHRAHINTKGIELQGFETKE